MLGISNRGLATLVSMFKHGDIELDEVPGTRVHEEIVHKHFDSVATHLEIRCSSTRLDTLELAQPHKLMQLLVAENAAIADDYYSAARACSPSMQAPWNLVVAYDEFTPSDSLKPNKMHKKSMCVYFSFMELMDNDGWLADAKWIPFAIARTAMHLSCGFSPYLRALVHCLVFGDAESDFVRLGAPAQSDGRDPILIFARLHAIISDADGLRAGYAWKGFRALRCCLKHSNVLAKNSDLAHRRPGFVEITNADPSLFIRTSIEEIDEIVDTLIAFRGSPTALGKLETGLGFAKSEYGLLADRSLRRHVGPSRSLIDVAHFDWMHCALQDCIFVTEANALFRQIGGTVIADIKAFLRDTPWQFPSSTNRNCRALHRIFDEWRSSTDGGIKCGCSEALCLFMVLNCWVEEHVLGPASTPFKESFRAMAKVISILLATKRRKMSMTDGAARLASAHRSYYRAHIAAYGDEHVKPKMHYIFDIAEQFEEFVRWCVLDMFVVERLHQTVRDIARLVDYTGRWERSILSAVINKKLETTESRHGLHGRIHQSELFPGVQCARSIASQHHFGVDDVVFWDDLLCCGIIQACCKEGDELFIIIAAFQQVSISSTFCSRWLRTPDAYVVRRPSSVVPACAWRCEGDLFIVLSYLGC